MHHFFEMILSRKVKRFITAIAIIGGIIALLIGLITNNEMAKEYGFGVLTCLLAALVIAIPIVIPILIYTAIKTKIEEKKAAKKKQAEAAQREELKEYESISNY